MLDYAGDLLFPPDYSPPPPLSHPRYPRRGPAHDGERAAALSLFLFLRDRLAPYKRIRRIEFVAQLPKTLSGKVRRPVLRQREADLAEVGARAEREFRIEDFPELA